MDLFNSGSDNIFNNNLNDGSGDNFFDMNSFGQSSDDQNNDMSGSNNFIPNQTPFDANIINDSNKNANMNTGGGGTLSPQAILTKNFMLDTEQIPMNSQQMFRQNSIRSASNSSQNSINMNINNSNMSNNNIRSPQMSNSRNPSTPQQILLMNNAQNQSNMNNNQNQTSMIQNPIAQLSNRGSPLAAEQSPATNMQRNDFVQMNNSNQNINMNNNRSYSNTKTKIKNNNNNNNTNNLTNDNNAYSDRAAMLASFQQQQQQQQQRMQAYEQPQQPQSQSQSQPQSQQPQPQPQPQPQSQSQLQPQPSLSSVNRTQMSQQRLSNQQIQQAQQQKAILQNLSPQLQQRISAELSNKQYELFMKSLLENSKRRNMQLQAIPEIQGRKVNLFFVYIMVQRFGGSDQVTRNQLWPQIAHKLQMTDAQQLESIYYKILLPYEKYMISPEGMKETQAKRIFLQQFLQELLKKVQQQQSQQQSQSQSRPQQQQQSQFRNQDTNQQRMPSQEVVDSSTASQQQHQQQFIMNQQQQQQLRQEQSQQQMLKANNSKAATPVTRKGMPTNTTAGAKKVAKKPRKPRQKKKTKKELELENKLKEEKEKTEKRIIEERQKQQNDLLEKKIKDQYEKELAKLPKVYKRTIIRNYKYIDQKIEHANGYDINYISNVGEKIDANKPIFLFAPELGTVNLHALSMSLQSNNLGEVNSALNSLLVTSADGSLNIPLNHYPFLLNAICMHGILIMKDLSRNWDSPKKLRLHQTNSSNNYCEEYNVEAYLKRNLTTYTKSEQLIDDVFDIYTKENVNRDVSTVIVDSLTGVDVSQDESITAPGTSLIDQSDDTATSGYGQNKVSNHPKKWKYLPDRLSFSHLSHLDEVELYTPSYVESLKKIKEEVDNIFTRVNIRNAEDPRILIIDQLSTISMILRNISFSDINATVMCSSHILKRFLSDLLWFLFLDNNKLIFERKILNFKKDIIILLSNISHNLKLDSELDAMLLLLLILSFGEPKISSLKNEDPDEISYSEYSINWGKYQTFGVDILAKVLALNHPNRSFIQSILLGKYNEERKSKNIEIVKRLVAKYNDGKAAKFLHDLVSFLISVIPFQQIIVQPSISDEVSPVILQALTSIYQIVELIDTEDCKTQRKIYQTESHSTFPQISELPLLWLTTFENIGVSLRRLYGFYQNLTMQNKNTSIINKMISCKCVKLLTLLFTKCSNDKESCVKLVKIPNMLPSETEFFTVLSNPIVDIDFVKEIQAFYHIRNEIYGKI